MRLDKFLKVSRIIKRRTLAKEVCDQGRVKINGLEAKASSIVKVGDQLEIRFGQKILTIRVDLLNEHSRKEDAKELYSLIKEESIQSNEDYTML
ncbi:RNA-binding S4 domain-containing protein [Rubeoparvulum massiliense]|uniref:RNA-binding S4 domain-containing protein n=1 Tax=Rubeoparvulum massiliense TaxID=1631346 RepID=UPI00065E81A4|nr:RNA-binding S4 domain-containing protein [Rubeoparvulum massiliense]